jgi:hypothetical protein
MPCVNARSCHTSRPVDGMFSTFGWSTTPLEEITVSSQQGVRPKPPPAG